MTKSIESFARHAVCAVVLSATLSATASSQRAAPPRGYVIELAGPRVGVTFLSGGVVSKLNKDAGIDISPMVTQFGWQTEKQFLTGIDGVVGVTELVGLVGGAEQGQFLPSASWLVGFRTSEGIEFAIGPNVTPVSFSLAFAGGMTHHIGALNVPVNLAIVPSSSGVRISLLTGFNLWK